MDWASFTAFTGETLHLKQIARQGLNDKGVHMRKFVIAAIVSSLCAGAAIAQTTPSTVPPATKAPATATPKAKVETKARSAYSIECSKQADAKGLHGKPRKTFRAKCMKDLKKKT